MWSASSARPVRDAKFSDKKTRTSLKTQSPTISRRGSPDSGMRTSGECSAARAPTVVFDGQVSASRSAIASASTPSSRAKVSARSVPGRAFGRYAKRPSR